MCLGSGHEGHPYWKGNWHASTVKWRACQRKSPRNAGVCVCAVCGCRMWVSAQFLCARTWPMDAACKVCVCLPMGVPVLQACACPWVCLCCRRVLAHACACPWVCLPMRVLAHGCACAAGVMVLTSNRAPEELPRHGLHEVGAGWTIDLPSTQSYLLVCFLIPGSSWEPQENHWDMQALFAVASDILPFYMS